MGKFAALLVLVSVAALIYFFKPQTQVEVSDQASPKPQPPLSAPATTPADQQVQQLKTPEPTPNQQAHDHANHQHDHGSENEIPEFIRQSLEAKRIPASELKQVEHPDGSVSMDLKGQYQHVPVAVLDKDGKVTIIEKVIEPIPEEKASE